MFKIIIIFSVIAVLFQNCLFGTESDVNDIKIGGLTYLQYEGAIDSSGLAENNFKVSRAYLNLKSRLNEYLSFRMTLDIFRGDNGVEERLKYLFAQFDLPDFVIIKDHKIKFGLIHTPWIDFEEHINLFRMQGTMFIERQHIMNSSDFGMSIEGAIGGEMDEEYKKNINKNYSGRYGSFSIGLFNGAGYHDFEANANKVIQGRFTLRPIPDVIPGLQLSYFGIYGKGNSTNKEKDNPKWQTNLLTLSYENEYLALNGQYINGQGDRLGELVDTSTGNSYKYHGFSFFVSAKLFNHWSLWGRFDKFEPSLIQLEDKSERLIIAIGYDFGNENILLIDYDHLKVGNQRTDLIKLTMQIDFEYRLDIFKR